MIYFTLVAVAVYVAITTACDISIDCQLPTALPVTADTVAAPAGPVLPATVELERSRVDAHTLAEKVPGIVRGVSVDGTQRMPVPGAVNARTLAPNGPGVAPQVGTADYWAINKGGTKSATYWINYKDGKARAAEFTDAINVNVRPALRAKLAPIVAAIRYAENGRAGIEFGILHPRVKPTYRSQAGWCAATVQKNHDRWVAAGAPGDFIAFLGAKYCPVGADNDPTGLNQHCVMSSTTPSPPAHETPSPNVPAPRLVRKPHRHRLRASPCIQGSGVRRPPHRTG